MGMVTDGVTDLVTLPASSVHPLPHVGEEVDYLLGMGLLGERKLILLDIDRLMAVRGTGRQRQAASASSCS
jgi:purine-binding chemotaxis protein CheW